MRILNIDLTTDGSGDAVVSAPNHIQGFLYAVQLVDGDFADGVDLDLDCVSDNLTYILLDKDDFNTDQMVYPRTLEHLDTDGSDLATHTTPIIVGKPRATIANGGATKTGAVRLFIADLP